MPSTVCRRPTAGLWDGLHPDALGVAYDAAAAVGGSRIAKLAGDQTAQLAALQQAHWAIHRAFTEYQRIGEDRRHLAADIGELIARFVDELVADRRSGEQAQQRGLARPVGAPNLHHSSGRKRHVDIPQHPRTTPAITLGRRAQAHHHPRASRAGLAAGTDRPGRPCPQDARRHPSIRCPEWRPGLPSVPSRRRLRTAVVGGVTLSYPRCLARRRNNRRPRFGAVEALRRRRCRR